MEKGYVHKFGIDFTDFFSLVARMETIQILLDLAAPLGVRFIRGMSSQPS